MSHEPENPFAEERARWVEEMRSQQRVMGAQVASLRAQLTKVREALEPFVRQVEEFHAGRWDEVDWPVAIDSLTKLAEAARAALASHPSSPEAKEST